MTNPEDFEIVNSIKGRSVLVAIIVCLFFAFFSFGITLLISIIVWFITSAIVNREIKLLRNPTVRFKKTYPFNFLGTSYGSFSHCFHHNYDLRQKLLDKITIDLIRKTPVSKIETISITDIDEELNKFENREFKVARSSITKRGSVVTLILKFSSFGEMQYIQWWVLADGYIDRNKKFNFIAYSPLSIWFWILPYLKNDHDIISRIRTIYSSTYNIFDIERQVKCLHDVLFEALIEELNNNGIDTSSLKLQRTQVMSIEISGGNVNMGNVVQGAMNKIVSGNKGAPL